MGGGEEIGVSVPIRKKYFFFLVKFSVLQRNRTMSTYIKSVGDIVSEYKTGVFLLDLYF